MAGNGSSFSPLTSLYSFTGQSDQGYPRAGLIVGSDGNLYGTTAGDGTTLCNPGQPCAGTEGTVYKITLGGQETTILDFPVTGTCPNCSLPDGAGPVAGLVQGKDGCFYGTTENGGSSYYYGTVFKITNGTCVNLYNFTGGNDGAYPMCALVQGNDGKLYGTTDYAGANNSGTVFVITTNGTLTTLYSFTGGSDGSMPMAGLALGSDGNFYGTTYQGGSYSQGTVFKITSGGSLTTLWNFTGGSDGSYPEAAVVQGSDGNLYGTTFSGGSGGAGVVFKVTTNGNFTALHGFSDAYDGGYPLAAVVQGSDGNIYGTTDGGGINNYGTVFVITTNNWQFTSLYSFTGTDGYGPIGALIQASDGNFYGTTFEGGAAYGTVFRIFPLNHSWSITNTITTAGAGTWTCPSNIYHVRVECWGAGGGGGSNGGGGGGGACSRVNYFPTVPGSTYNYLVGAHGSPDNPGTYSSFNQYSSPEVVAMGGAPGENGSGGQAGASTGDVKYTGGNGAAEFGGFYCVMWTGAGGGAAGNSSGGNSSTSYNYLGGAGGYAGGGNGGNCWEITCGGTTQDSPATAPGGGGAGGPPGHYLQTSAAADGQIRISY